VQAFYKVLLPACWDLDLTNLVWIAWQREAHLAFGEGRRFLAQFEHQQDTIAIRTLADQGTVWVERADDSLDDADDLRIFAIDVDCWVLFSLQSDDRLVAALPELNVKCFEDRRLAVPVASPVTGTRSSRRPSKSPGSCQSAQASTCSSAKVCRPSG